MFQRIRKLPVLCMVALGMMAALCLASLCRADTIDAAALQQEDARLEKPVSLSARSLSLKSILDQFAAQTGIAMTIDARDPASGIFMLVECRQTSVGKMMNALYSLLSIQGGEWAWEREGKAGAYTYTFHETVKAKRRTDTYNRIMNGLMNRYVTLLRQLAPMTMAERKPYRAALKKALCVTNEAMLDGFFENEGFWIQSRFFFAALTPEQQEAVLQGGSASVTLTALSPAVYDLYHQDYVRMNPHTRTPEGTLVPVPEPESIQFRRADPNRPLRQIAPRIDLVDPSGAMSWMGTGHLEFGIRDALKAAWMLPGDQMTDPAGQTLVVEPKETEAIRQEKAQENVENERFRKLFASLPQPRPFRGLGSHKRFCLEQLAQGSSTPLLAMLPGDDQDRSSTPIGKSVQTFLDGVEGNLKFTIYKWRDGVLLVNYTDWFTEPLSVISYALLHSLHPDKQSHIPLLELTELMRKISDDQAQWFAANNGLEDFKQLRPCLLFAARYPRVLQPDGDSIDAETIHALQAASILPPAALLSETPQLRLREEIVRNRPQIASWLHVEEYNAEKRKWELLRSIPLSFCSEILAQQGLERKGLEKTGSPAVTKSLK